MAVTLVTPVALVKDTMSADIPDASGTAINSADTMEIPYPQEGKLLIILNNTFAGAKNFIFSVTDEPFVQHDLGALTLSLAQADIRFIVLSSDRFKRKDGNIELSFEAATTGFVKAFYIPA